MSKDEHDFVPAGRALAKRPRADVAALSDGHWNSYGRYGGRQRSGHD